MGANWLIFSFIPIVSNIINPGIDIDILWFGNQGSWFNPWIGTISSRLCASSWIIKEYTLLREGKGSISKICVLTCEKRVIYPHQKLHNRFSILQIIKSLIHITCAFAASTRRKMTIVLQLIPKNLQLSEEISNGSLTLMEFWNFLLKVVNLRNILLSKMISQIVIDCQGNVFIDDTSLKLTRNWVCQPSPTILSHLIQAWTAKGVDTNGDDKVSVPSMKPSLFFGEQSFPHCSCPSWVILTPCRRLSHKHSIWTLSMVQK